MRKIEKEMIKAAATINQQETPTCWKKDNTVVTGKRGFVTIYLHDNHIASFVDGMLEVNLDTLRRWPSMTTRSRLRALGADLVSIKGVLHLNGESIYANK